ncbi:MAG: MXAN_5808 family serine peptidase [Polyangiales bacterium]
MKHLQRFGTPLLALVAIALAFRLSQSDHRGHAQQADPSDSAAAARAQRPYGLSQVRVLSRAIREVSDGYVDPDRVNHQRMFLAGLNAIQRSVAPVMVDYREGEDRVHLQVRSQQASFAVSDINSPWALTDRFRQVFEFLEANLGEETDLDLRDVEYAAVNGMLRTLDPHTNLLTPDVFEEMRMSTHGEFGGLGIVISIRGGHLTVIRPMPNTPASRAGLERGDRIVKIDAESTLNMPLAEAVSRLRGEPGSPVDVWYSRGSGSSWSAPRRVRLVRAIIHIESVEHRMLANNIGYVKVSGFQGNTTEDLQRALVALHRENLRGLVLDLRGNPGGLLDQAVRIADLFLTSGPIVSTDARDSRNRDQKFAQREGTEPNYPLVVLINGGSASASEIVAGALKNHNRALVIGQTSFGKGSVQVLQNFEDGSALKLTIAQYLTPGEISIQGVGIVPDINVVPMTVDRENMDLLPNETYLREADLRAALTHDSARQSGAAVPLVRYYFDAAARRRLAEADPDANEENEEEAEFLIRFAQQILAGAQRPGRLEMLSDAADVISSTQAREMDRAVAELRALGVDWSTGPNAGPSPAEVVLSTSAPNNQGRAGQDFVLTARVTNRGEHPLYQVRAITKSDYGLFNGRELVFGRINPGETREWSTTLGLCTTEEPRNQRVCRLPRDIIDRADAIRVEFSEEHERAPAPAEIRTELHALVGPQFAYSLQVADDVRGNGDGQLQVGELGSIYMRVRNVGEGPTFGVQANLRNLSGAGVLLHAGRFELEPIAPGAERMVRFTFEVLPEFRRETAKLEISVYDTELRESVVENVEVPLTVPAREVSAASGRVQVAAGTELRAWADPSAPVVAIAETPTSVSRTATLGEFARVDLGEGRPAWVLAASLGSGAARGELTYPITHRAPTIEISTHDQHVTRDATFTLRGTARDDQRVRDLYVFVGARKVLYRAAPAPDTRELPFEASVPLHGGINYITVFVRESDEVISREVLQVRRDAPDGSLMETPRFDEELYDVVHE